MQTINFSELSFQDQQQLNNQTAADPLDILIAAEEHAEIVNTAAERVHHLCTETNLSLDEIKQQLIAEALM